MRYIIMYISVIYFTMCLYIFNQSMTSEKSDTCTDLYSLPISCKQCHEIMVISTIFLQINNTLVLTEN